MTRRVSHLLFDFDCTITTEDTLHLIASAAYMHHTHLSQRVEPTSTSDRPVLCAPNFPSWSRFGQAHMQDFAGHTATFGPRKTLDRELEYLVSLKPVELASVERVEQSGLFVGVTEAEIQAQAKFVKLRDAEGLADLLSKALEKGARIGVISVTWSTVLVRAALGRFVNADILQRVDIRANDVVMDEDHKGTGSLTKRKGEEIVTGDDKLRVLRDLTGHRSSQPMDDLNGIVVYAGDSRTDLACLLEADVGVVVGNDKGLMETCQRNGIQVEQGVTSGLPKIRNTLYTINTWKELVPLLEKL